MEQKQRNTDYESRNLTLGSPRCGRRSGKQLGRLLGATIFALAFVGKGWCQANVNEKLETAVLYVDTANGSDSNPGTSSLPLKTIGAGVGLAETNNKNNIGTRLIVNPGTYRESIQVQPPYQSTNMPITVQAATNGTVTISGAQQFTGWRPYAAN